MSVLDELFTVIRIGRDATEQPSVHYECRRCGTTLSKHDTACSLCGSTDITEIQL